MRMEGIVLAAGYSSRAGGMKMTFSLGGRPLLARSIDILLPFCETVYVVTGYRRELLSDILEEYGEKVQEVYNPDYPSGMYSSVRAGMQQIKEKRMLLTPGDYPLLTTGAVKRLLEMPETETKCYIPSYKGRGGHPILLPAVWIPDIMQGNESSLREFLRNKEKQYVDMEEPGVCQDVDTPEAFREAVRIWEGGAYRDGHS